MLGRHEKLSCSCVKYSGIGLGVLQKTIITQHSPWLHQEMPLETLPCKDKSIHQYYAETLPSFLGLSLSQMIWKTVEMWSDECTIQLVLGKMDIQLKIKGTIQTFFSERSKNQHLSMGLGLHQCPQMCEGTIDTEAYVKILKRDTFWHQDHIFSKEVHSYFSNTMPGLILHVTTLWLQTAFPQYLKTSLNTHRTL